MIDKHLLASCKEYWNLISSFYYFEELDSTNEFAKRLNDDKSLIITDHQFSGRGRQGRKWESEKDMNLTFSLRLRLDIDKLDLQSVNYFFTYYTLIAIQEFILEQSTASFQDSSIKWPNDIFINHKKISGILIENTLNKMVFIIGIGINVNQQSFQNDYEYKTTSLSQILNRNCNINVLLFKLLNTYENNIYLLSEKKYIVIFNRWMEKCDMIGKEITLIDSKNKEIKAFVSNLSYDGGIKLLVKGKEQTFYSGDVRVAETVT